MLKEGWNVLADADVRETFTDLKDCAQLANIIISIERKPVTFILVLDGHIRELMRF